MVLYYSMAWAMEILSWDLKPFIVATLGSLWLVLATGHVLEMVAALLAHLMEWLQLVNVSCSKFNLASYNKIIASNSWFVFLQL